MFPLHQAPEKKMKRRHCPTRKLKYFNDAWAQIAADELSEKFNSHYDIYRCICGWWHTYDQSKKHAKENQRESRSTRRRRAARGESSPLQVLREQQRREEAAFQRRRKKTRKEIPIRVWEDDGGACVWPARLAD